MIVSLLVKSAAKQAIVIILGPYKWQAKIVKSCELLSLINFHDMQRDLFVSWFTLCGLLF